MRSRTWGGGPATGTDAFGDIGPMTTDPVDRPLELGVPTETSKLANSWSLHSAAAALDRGWSVIEHAGCKYQSTVSTFRDVTIYHDNEAGENHNTLGDVSQVRPVRELRHKARRLSAGGRHHGGDRPVVAAVSAPSSRARSCTGRSGRR